MVQKQLRFGDGDAGHLHTSSRVVFEALDDVMVIVDFHAVLTSESVCHVSFLKKQLVDLFVKKVKTRISLCVREIRKRCEETAEDDEQVDERVDEPVDVDDDDSKKRSNLSRTRSAGPPKFSFFFSSPTPCRFVFLSRRRRGEEAMTT